MIRSLVLATLLAAPPIAAPVPCVTRAEGEAIVAWALPAFVEGAARRCGPALTGDAFLPRAAAGLASRWRGGGQIDAAKARAALERVAGAALPGAIGQALAQQIDPSVVADALLDSVRRKDCGRLDRAIALAAPLPPMAVAGLVTLFVEVGQETDRAALPFRICAGR